MLPKRDLTYQSLWPDHLRIFFIAKLSTKRVQENYTDGVQAARSVRKEKIYLFVLYFRYWYAPTWEARCMQLSQINTTYVMNSRAYNKS